VENIFDLPVFTPGKREEWFEQDYFSVNHRIGRAGIIVDESFRPVEGPWDNLHACGAILAHVEALKNGCGHGFALATGRAAAENLLEAGR
jgi:glycerol-3-phosphate dehydrogenase subunit B